MGLSPSRMPQAQGMMAGHGGGNMVGQTASQGQFLAQTQFPPGSAAVAATGAMNVTVGPGIGQPPAQAAVTQVRHEETQGLWSRSQPCPLWSSYNVVRIPASSWGFKIKQLPPIILWTNCS